MPESNTEYTICEKGVPGMKKKIITFILFGLLCLMGISGNIGEATTGAVNLYSALEQTSYLIFRMG